MRTGLRIPARAALALALMVVASAAAAQDREPPRVSADRNGQTEVVVDGDCVVNFNARGERTRYSADCREGQLRRAERADTRYREERAAGAAAQREPDADREPRVTVQQDGQARVVLGRDCEVSYDREGRRQAWSAGCGGEQLARADGALAQFMREREPRITVQRDGQARVDVGRDCEVGYDAEGRRRAQSPGCDNREVARADRAMAEYIRDREPKITVQRDGDARVVVGRDCEVSYDAQGRRRAQSAGCGNREVARADGAIAAYLRDREPRVTMLQGGLARVAVGRSCEVSYDRDGSRRAQAQGCSGAETALADRSMADYRRQHGLDRTQRPGVVTAVPGVVTPIPGTGGPGDERPGHGKGHVTMTADGGSVTFTNGCVVNYSADGQRRGGMRLCSAGQLGRADELMFTYRQMQEAPRGGS